MGLRFCILHWLQGFRLRLYPCLFSHIPNGILTSALCFNPSSHNPQHGAKRSNLNPQHQVSRNLNILVGVEPVGAGAMAGGEAHAALVGVLHFLYHNAGHLLEFVGAYIEVEFVVYL